MVSSIAQNGPISDSLPPVFDEGRGRWHVLHTKSRQEKILSADLTAMGLFHYLPLVRQIRHYGRHKTMVEIPLFAGYLFLRATLDAAYQADRTHRVAHIIRVPNQQQLQRELVNLHLALESGNELTPFPFLKNGVRAEVKSGPLRGLQGVIENRANAGRLILQVEMLGRAVSLEIDGALLEPIQ